MTWDEYANFTKENWDKIRAEYEIIPKMTPRVSLPTKKDKPMNDFDNLPTRYKEFCAKLYKENPRESSQVTVVASKHGAWIQVYKNKSYAVMYALEEGYKFVKSVHEFGVIRDIYQHPTRDREYAIFEITIK